MVKGLRDNTLTSFLKKSVKLCSSSCDQLPSVRGWKRKSDTFSLPFPSLPPSLPPYLSQLSVPAAVMEFDSLPLTGRLRECLLCSGTSLGQWT